MALNFTDTVSSSSGSDGTEVSFTFAPTSVVAGEAGIFEFSVVVGESPNDIDPTELDAEVTASLYVAGQGNNSVVDTQTVQATEGDTVNGSFSHEFSPDEETRLGNTRIDEPIWIKVGIDYYGEPGFSKDSDPDHTANTRSIKVDVTPQPEEVVEFPGEAAGAGISQIGGAHRDTTRFRIENIEYEEDAAVRSLFNEQDYEELDGGGFRVGEIPFDYENPTVAIDGAGRFAKHEIIGGKTVRQKIGEDPLNVSITGVCKQDTATRIDSLRDARHGTIYSDRLPEEEGSLRVQFGSTSTEPMTDGGAAELKSGELLYSFTINTIEVAR